MNNDFNELFKDEAFAKIEPERKRALIEFAGRIEGKGMNEVMEEIITFGRNMPQGKPLSSEEKKAMISAVYSKLNEADKIKFNSVLKILDGLI